MSTIVSWLFSMVALHAVPTTAPSPLQIGARETSARGSQLVARFTAHDGEHRVTFLESKLESKDDERTKH